MGKHQLLRGVRPRAARERRLQSEAAVSFFFFFCGQRPKSCRALKGSQTINNNWRSVQNENGEMREGRGEGGEGRATGLTFRKQLLLQSCQVQARERDRFIKTPLGPLHT